MNTKNNNNLKLTIKNLKKEKFYKKYKVIFRHPSTRFILTYILNYFYNSFTKDQQLKLSELERSFTENENLDIHKFSEIFKTFSNLLPTKYKNIEWASFGKYFYYVWAISRFNYDKKHHISNIYLVNDIIYLNQEKRNYFYHWVKDLKKIDNHFNLIILYIQKLGV